MAKELEVSAVEEALSTPALRKVLSACIGQGVSVKDISDHAQVPIASAYRHVKALQERGILTIERSAMTADGKPFDLYRSRVRVARLEVDHAGSSVSWELDVPVDERLVRLWSQLRWA